jgi:methionine-rich copper-binding protein CopC
MQRFHGASMRLLLTFSALLLFSVISVGSVSAHAHLVSSNPADGAVLTSQPAVITAVYGEETSLTKTTFEVTFATDAKSAPHKVADGKVDVNNRTNISAALPAGLGNGIYVVKWHTVTEDDNGLADGTFSFTVSGSASSGSTGGANAGSSGDALPTTGQGDALLVWLAVVAVAFTLLCSGLAMRLLARR